MPSTSRTCASGTCSCSRAPTSRSTGPSCCAQAAYGLGDLLRVERVVDPPVPGEVLLRAVGGSRSTGSRDDAEADARQLRRAVATNRAVACEQEGRDERSDHHARDATRRVVRPSVRRSSAWRGSMPGVNVVFVEPFFPPTQRQFVRALAEVGATVIGIGESSDGLARRASSRAG